MKKILLEFTKSENALWNVVTSFDINVLRNSFAQLDPSIRIENKRVFYYYLINAI